MNKWKKLGLAAGMGTAAFTTAHIINQCIFQAAVSDKITENKSILKYKWRLGNVAYTVCGKGSPLLLIHDLKPESSSYEWKRVVKALAKKHTVYTIDLLGCGYSDKPNITYTAYMYTQLLNDFIVNVIARRVSVAATGQSAPLTIMAAYNNPYLFDKIVLVSPESIRHAMINPGKHSNIRKMLLNTPVLGTMLYNIFVNRHEINRKFTNEEESYERTEGFEGEPEKRGLIIQPYDDSPLDRESVGETVYLELINRAFKYLYIFTPYLVLDDFMRTALCNAAKRGVDVRIVTPGIPDKKTVFRLTRANYGPLLKAGVRIYEYTPGFIHAKSMVCDDETAVVGTINLDYRSLYLHFENAVYFSHCPAVGALKKDCLAVFKESKKISLEDTRQTFIGRLFDSVLRVFETLL